MLDSHNTANKKNSADANSQLTLCHTRVMCVAIETTQFAVLRFAKVIVATFGALGVMSNVAKEVQTALQPITRTTPSKY